MYHYYHYRQLRCYLMSRIYIPQLKLYSMLWSIFACFSQIFVLTGRTFQSALPSYLLHAARIIAWLSIMKGNCWLKILEVKIIIPPDFLANLDEMLIHQRLYRMQCSVYRIQYTVFIQYTYSIYNIVQYTYSILYSYMNCVHKFFLISSTET